jgi:hypothetical protein
LLAAGLAVAEAQPKKAKPQSRKLDPNTADRFQPPLPPPSPYVERDASKMRFGSSEWWEQMQREGRLGGERP